MPATSCRAVRSALLAAAAALCCTTAGAALYKWTDANGRVVYSDQPPIGNVKAEIVGSAAPSSNPDAVKEMANREAEFKKRQLDRVEDAKKADKSRADAQKLAAFCQQARAQVAGLARVDTVMFRVNEKGERVAMDEAARKAEAERLELMMRERKCDR